MRKGDNINTNSLAIIDLKTGKPVWAKLFVTHDVRDWDLSQTSPLLTADFKGKSRDLVVIAGKDGRVRFVDRNTHEILVDLAVSKQENVDTLLAPQGRPYLPGKKAETLPGGTATTKLVVLTLP
ncbi:MAG: hypothetical protein ACLP8A_06190 [Methylovirgula sp.]